MSINLGREIRFTVAGASVPKERVRVRVVTPKGKRPFAQLYTPAETRDYEARVAAAARTAWRVASFAHNLPVEPSTRPIELQITVYDAIPEGWPKWKQVAAARGDILPTGKPDLDNVTKAIADGMNGVVFKDDAQIATVDAVKLYTCDGGARVEVAVRENRRCASWITRIADLVLLRDR